MINNALHYISSTCENCGFSFPYDTSYKKYIKGERAHFYDSMVSSWENHWLNNGIRQYRIHIAKSAADDTSDFIRQALWSQRRSRSNHKLSLSAVANSSEVTRPYLRRGFPRATEASELGWAEAPGWAVVQKRVLVCVLFRVTELIVKRWSNTFSGQKVHEIAASHGGQMSPWPS